VNSCETHIGCSEQRKS